jgi:hypothetical protein
MKPIIPPVDRAILRSELSEELLVRPSNKGGNLIYDFHASQAPNAMREIGRLRELAFRGGGGGTGEALDIDRFDIEEPYRQLIVWDPEHEQIVGGYRYILLANAHILPSGEPDIVSTHMFAYSDKFLKDYMPQCAELGRAFVQPMYHDPAMGIKSIVSLDNLWDGIGALVYNTPNLKYMIGKVTIYPEYNAEARNLIYAFLEKYFHDDEHLLKQRKPLDIPQSTWDIAQKTFDGDDKQANYSRLKYEVRQMGTLTPPLFNAYVGLSDTMRTFGTGINDEFGNIYDTGIMITIDDIFPEKKERYIASYAVYKQNKNAVSNTQ